MLCEITAADRCRGGDRAGDRAIDRRSDSIGASPSLPAREAAAVATPATFAAADSAVRGEASRLSAERARLGASLFERNRQARLRLRPNAHDRTRRRSSSAYKPDFLKSLYEQMVLIREFEDGVKFLFLEGAMPGTIHQCQGQEATAVGVCAALEAS